MLTRPSMLIAMLYLIATIACAPKGYEALQQRVQALAEENEVISVANRLFACTDDRDWQCVRDVFAPEVLFDMTSLAGGRPVKMTPGQIADGWDQGLRALKAVHHQAGNYQVSLKGSEADLFCYGTAFHYLPNPSGRDTRTFVGSYNYHLVKTQAGWKIDAFKFNLKFIDGNKDLEGAGKK